MITNGYHDDFASLSKTMLNLFCHSRLEFYHTYVKPVMQPKIQTKVMLSGTVLHAMLLEDRLFSDLVLPYPDWCLKSNGDLNGKVAASFREEHPDCEFLKMAECDAIRAVVESVLKHPDLGKLMSAATDRERRFDARIFGIDCKCRPDIICDLGDRVVIYDLKFSECVDADSWRRNSRRFRYWLQDSHYSAVVEAALGKPVQFRFCLIEVAFPFRVQWKWYDPSSRESSRKFHREKIEELAVCHETGDWSDRWQSVMVLEPWDMESDAMVDVEQ